MSEPTGGYGEKQFAASPRTSAEACSMKSQLKFGEGCLI